jgi:hypothetical protein
VGLIAVLLLVRDLSFVEQGQPSSPEAALEIFLNAVRQGRYGYAWAGLSPTAREQMVSAPELGPVITGSGEFSMGAPAGMKAYARTFAVSGQGHARTMAVKRMTLRSSEDDVAEVDVVLAFQSFPQWVSVLGLGALSAPSLVSPSFPQWMGPLIAGVLVFVTRKRHEESVTKTMLRGQNGAWYVYDADLFEGAEDRAFRTSSTRSARKNRNPRRSESPAAGTPASPARATVGQRVAGALLIGNALLVLALAAFGPHGPAAAHAVAPAATIIPSVIDLGIGATLVAGKRRIIPWAMARVGLGLVVLTALQWSSPAAVVLQVLVSGALLLLLLGDAAQARIAVGASTFGLYAIVSASLVSDAATKQRRTVEPSSTLEPEPVQVVTGVTYPYTLTFPGDGWYLHSRRTRGPRRRSPASRLRPRVTWWGCRTRTGSRPPTSTGISARARRRRRISPSPTGG